jgi:hypothetical protein
MPLSANRMRQSARHERRSEAGTMTTPKWPYEKVIGKRRVHARLSDSEILVRVENDGDNSKYAEFIYPRSLGMNRAIEHAALEARDEDIRD